MLIGLLAYATPWNLLFILDRHLVAGLADFVHSKKLPARFARLPWMAAMVVATAASASKTIASASRAIGLRFCLVDGQGSSAQISSVERRDRFVSFGGIGHFDKSETTGLARFPVGHESDFLNWSV
jgi:hypothetical protein